MCQKGCVCVWKKPEQRSTGVTFRSLLWHVATGSSSAAAYGERGLSLRRLRPLERSRPSVALSAAPC